MLVEVVVVADDLVEEVSIASASQLQLKRRKKSRVATMIPTTPPTLQDDRNNVPLLFT